MSCSKLVELTDDFKINGSRARLLRDILLDDPTIIRDWSNLKDHFVVQEDHRFEIEQLFKNAADSGNTRAVILQTLKLWSKEKPEKATFKKCLNIMKVNNKNYTSSQLLKYEQYIRRGHDVVYCEDGTWFDCTELSAGRISLEDEKLTDIIPEQCISKDWIVANQSRNVHDRFYYVKDHPRAPGKTVNNYAPAREMSITIDCIIISQVNRCSLQGVLASWIDKGLSTNFIIPQHNVVVQWVDPRQAKAQMAGKWNSRSIEILMLTDENQEANASQIARLAKIYMNYTRTSLYKIDIKYLGSHQEAQGSGYEGKVGNIQTIRESLGLGKLPPF